MGEYEHKVKEIYNIPSIDNTIQEKFSVAFEGLQPKAYEDVAQTSRIYTPFLQQRNPHFYKKFPFEDCYGYLLPSNLGNGYGQQGVKDDIIRDALRVEDFIENIKKILTQVNEALQKSHEKNKTRHDEH